MSNAEEKIKSGSDGALVAGPSLTSNERTASSGARSNEIINKSGAAVKRKKQSELVKMANDGEWWHFSYGDKEWAYADKMPDALYGQKMPDEIPYARQNHNS
ncbi:MAG: hypothetical protein LBT45_01700 [Rickettsiales bacterium]|nr:hypothetical protein [Rickettsiales bacterium]